LGLIAHALRALNCVAAVLKGQRMLATFAKRSFHWLTLPIEALQLSKPFNN
jgi:hypothetical protein